MKYSLIFFTGLLLLITLEVLRVYFIMPFPVSQQSNTIDIAYFLHNNIFRMRLVLIALILLPCYRIIKNKKWLTIVASVILVTLYGFLFYLFNFQFLADKMFYKPDYKIFAHSATNKISLGALVIGIEINGESKAFPIEIIGYHHQVEDTIGHERVLITYCTVCRTGRVYSPFINGKAEIFRLVGMDHFNAMFEDGTTKTWWRQATGEAIAGQLKGQSLKEIPSHQMSLASWLTIHPQSEIMQGDEKSQSHYDHLKGFDNGTIEGSLEKRDTASWQNKSWIVGIVNRGLSRAYDWNDLEKLKVINDTLNGDAIILILNKDKESFNAFYATTDSSNKPLQFFISDPNPQNIIFSDKQTKSVWNFNGVCLEGSLKGERLQSLQSYQEFWHSWKTFHPNTTTY